MQHIDEHTIELYVLGSAQVREQKPEIEAHLKECCGCRMLAEEMDQFYRETFENLEQERPESARTEALVRLQRDVALYNEPYFSPVPYQPSTVTEKFRYFTSHHPITTGAGSFAALTVLALALIFGLRDLTRDHIPSYTHINPESATIEVYNKENQLLWGIPARSVYHLNDTQYGQASNQVIVTSLIQGEGNNVITTLPVQDNQSGYTPLTIFSENGEVIHKTYFTSQILFRGVKYNTELNPDNVIIQDFSRSGSKDIVVTTNNGRSPNVVYRLAADGHILGEYIHFGLLKMTTLDINHDGRLQLVLFGENDTGEPDSLPYPVAIILDAGKLTGRTQAGDSPGFGLPSSQAEIAIIRFPFSDMNLALNAKGMLDNFNQIRYGDEVAFSTNVLGQSANPSTDHVPTFEYILGADLRIREVKFDSYTLLYRDRMLADGKIHGKLDSSYLEDLKNGVRYWNGRQWTNQAVRIDRTGPSAVQ